MKVELGEACSSCTGGQPREQIAAQPQHQRGLEALGYWRCAADRRFWHYDRHEYLPAPLSIPNPATP